MFGGRQSADGGLQIYLRRLACLGTILAQIILRVAYVFQEHWIMNPYFILPSKIGSHLVQPAIISFPLALTSMRIPIAQRPAVINSVDEGGSRIFTLRPKNLLQCRSKTIKPLLNRTPMRASTAQVC